MRKLRKFLFDNGKWKFTFIGVSILVIASVILIVSSIFCGFTNNMQSEKYKVNENKNSYIYLIKHLDNDIRYDLPNDTTLVIRKDHDGGIKIEVYSQSTEVKASFYNKFTKAYLSSETFTSTISIYHAQINNSIELMTYSPKNVNKSFALQYTLTELDIVENTFNAYMVANNIIINEETVTLYDVAQDCFNYGRLLITLMVIYIILATLFIATSLFILIEYFIYKKNDFKENDIISIV